MQFYKLITCCVIAGSFVACKSGSSEPTFDPSLVSADSGKSNPAAAATTANPNVAPFVPTVNPATTTTPIVNATTTTVQPAVTAEGSNPPHGQPNHRCDIPVGAPLNSPPGKQPAAVQTNAASGAKVTQTTTVTPVATTTKTAPGMNPPHGEPGHRCDIAVGAPLNSPKKTETPVTIPINTDAVKAVDSAKS